MKAITCPQCGSPHHRLTASNSYQCESCGSSYKDDSKRGTYDSTNQTSETIITSSSTSTSTTTTSSTSSFTTTTSTTSSTNSSAQNTSSHIHFK